MLGADFTAEFKAAWAELHALVSETMKQAAHQLCISPGKIQEIKTENKTSENS